MTTMTKAGRYEIIGELGRGAMGVVYKAMDPVIGRTVAVKTIRLSEEGTGLTRPELLTRFQTEARAAGLLTHPNIVVVFDAGEEDGLYYITMELVEGKSLQALMDGGQAFALPRILRIMEQTCSALQFAHERNVVHRDIKPANLMLTADDAVKVSDFGTAKILQFGTIQQTAHVMGTPSYMSPEQVKGRAVDGRSDIFSLGVMLYEMVTGEKPFPGQSITTVIYKIVNEDPVPPKQLNPSIHPGLSDVVMRALAKDPETRYQSCREMLEDLRNYRSLSGAGGNPDATLVTGRGNANATLAMGAMGSMGTMGGGSGLDDPMTAATVWSPAARAGSPLHTPSVRRTGTVTPYEQPKKKSVAGTVFVALCLLGVIAYGGYKLRPVFQAARQPQAAEQQLSTGPQPATGQAQAAAQQPAVLKSSANEAVPVTTGTAPESAPPSGSAGAANSTGFTIPIGPTGSPSLRNVVTDAPKETAASNTSVSETKPLEVKEEKATPAKPEPAKTEPAKTQVAKTEAARTEPALSTAAAEYKGRIEEAVAEKGLGGQIKVQGAGNTLTLAGNLHPREHGELLKFMRNAPSDVHVVDHIEYDDTPVASAGNGDSGGHPVPSRGNGAIHVVTDVIGATASMHGATGRVVEQCQTPCSFNDLAPGRYSLEVQKSGYQPVQTALQVRAGKVHDQKISLESLAKGLFVSTRPPGADVFINGDKQSGQTPVTLPLAPGGYNLVLRLQGYEAYAGNVQVKENIQTQLVDVELKEKSTGHVAWAQVTTVPNGAEILIDGASTGQSTPARVQVPAGLHTFTMRINGFQPAQTKVELSEGGTVNVSATLTKK